MKLSSTLIKGRTFGVVWLIWPCLFACSPHDSTANLSAKRAELAGALEITGSSTITPMLLEIGGQFTRLHPDVKLHISAGGSGRGISDSRAAKSDIGMVSRVLTDQEQDLKGFPIARDGVGLLVHRDNPVNNLTSAQVARIFKGQIKNWREVGGRNAPILVVDRGAGRGVTELFLGFFALRQSEIHPDLSIGDNSQLIETVVANKDAISFFSMLTAERQRKGGRPVKLLSLNGVQATRATVLNGVYPLTRPLTLVTRDLPRGLTKSFIEYCLSPQVTSTIENMGFVPYEE